MAEIYDLSRTGALLSWDQLTYMPSGGAEDRGYQLGTVARLEHERWVADETGRLLEDLEKDMLPGLEAELERGRVDPSGAPVLRQANPYPGSVSDRVYAGDDHGPGSLG